LSDPKTMTASTGMTALAALLARHRHHDAAQVRRGAVFPQVDALPGAEQQLAAAERDGDRTAGKSTLRAWAAMSSSPSSAWR
jgi:hypothetical protein